MKLTSSVVEGFVKSVLASKFDDPAPTPDFHREGWDLFTGQDRMVALAAPRGHAKTTGMTVSYGLSTLLFRERRFMIVVSDTESQSAMFLGYMKDQLQNNQDLVELFGIKRDGHGIVQFVKDTETDVIVEFEEGGTFRIIAKGAEQKMRGLLWNGTRPDIILCDDMENDELVMNKERRDKMRKWFYSALLPCLSSKGIIRVVGTILHMDSLLERLMPKPFARFSHQEPLKLWCEAKHLCGGWKSIKYRAHNDDFTHILWPEKHSKSTLLERRAEFIAMGLPDKYSQEYLNVPLDESVAYFKRIDFENINEDDRKLALKYYITVDLAIAETERADYSVFLVAGVDENRKIHVKNVIREKLDGREIVDMILALENAYEPEFIGIEDMQVTKSIGPFLKEEMVRQNIWPNIEYLKHGGKDKIARARSIQARMRAKNVCFDKQGDWYEAFESELTRFPRDTHDDQVDCFAYLGMLLDKVVQASTKEEMEDELFYDEQEKNMGTIGRSSYTGY